MWFTEFGQKHAPEFIEAVRTVKRSSTLPNQLVSEEYFNVYIAALFGLSALDNPSSNKRSEDFFAQAEYSNIPSELAPYAARILARHNPLGQPRLITASDLARSSRINTGDVSNIGVSDYSTRIVRDLFGTDFDNNYANIHAISRALSISLAKMARTGTVSRNAYDHLLDLTNPNSEMNKSFKLSYRQEIRTKVLLDSDRLPFPDLLGLQGYQPRRVDWALLRKELIKKDADDGLRALLYHIEQGLSDAEFVVSLVRDEAFRQHEIATLAENQISDGQALEISEFLENYFTDPGNLDRLNQI